jgi:hypothetical protein
MNSSDWVANENEWRDSLGKRVRSSPNARAGEAGAGAGTEGSEPEGCLETGGVMCSEAAREVDNLEPGCWRMRRRPEEPMPCSCSGRMGDLSRRECLSTERVAWSRAVSPCHAVQLARNDAHSLGVERQGRGRHLREQIARALILGERDMVGSEAEDVRVRWSRVVVWGGEAVSKQVHV